MSKSLERPSKSNGWNARLIDNLFGRFEFGFSNQTKIAQRDSLQGFSLKITYRIQFQDAFNGCFLAYAMHMTSKIRCI